MSSPPPGSVVAAQGLTKRYGGRRGVDDVSFAVRPGEIYALLGRNGAGKTTTIRMLVGLSRADQGLALLLGQPSRLGADVLARVGVVIDGPAFVPHLSGRRNLQLLWRAGGRRWPPPALEESLALAGLGASIEQKVKSYSMGMRQRLTIAQALMGDPEVLVLDEPANGLDPGEVRALREHLERKAADGAAILVSSHLLAEVELLATHAVVIDHGAVVADGPLAELVGHGACEFEVDDIHAAQAALRDFDGVQSIEPDTDRILVTAPDLSTQELTRQLVAAGVGVAGVRAERRLEDVFLGLVGDDDDAR
ncbi:MAG: ATP-binding cassette domain-containing protein [Solirubrobacteraceae bacterium]